MQKVRYRYPTDDCGFIELDHRMLREEFVNRLRNVSGVQMVSVLMMFKKPKKWLFLDDWRILPDLEGSAASGAATADPPGAIQNSTDSSDANITRIPRIDARRRMLKGLLLEARRKHAMRKRTRSSSSFSSGRSTASGIAAEAPGLQTRSETLPPTSH